MVKVKTRYIVGSLINTNGTKRYYIEMDPKYIEPVANKSIQTAHRSLKIGEIVTSGSTHNFLISELPDIINQIDDVVRFEGLK